MQPDRRNQFDGVRETREFHVADFQIREAEDGDGYTLVGLAAPFDEPTDIRDQFGTYTEVIRPGAFTRTIRERGHKIKLLAMHNRGSFPLGNIPRLWESARGLELEARISKTSAGEDARTLIQDGVVNGLSIGFICTEQRWNEANDHREVVEAMLIEISLVTEPAYASAGVEAMRSTDDVDVNDDPPAEDEVDTVDDEARAALLADYARLYGTPVDGVQVTTPPPIGDERALNGWSIADLRPLLTSAIDAAMADGDRCWVVDISDDWCVVQVIDSEYEASLVRIGFSVDADGVVTLGDQERVVAKVTYLPDPTAPEDDQLPD